MERTSWVLNAVEGNNGEGEIGNCELAADDVELGLVGGKSIVNKLGNLGYMSEEILNKSSLLISILLPDWTEVLAEPLLNTFDDCVNLVCRLSISWVVSELGSEVSED